MDINFLNFGMHIALYIYEVLRIFGETPIIGAAVVPVSVPQTFLKDQKDVGLQFYFRYTICKISTTLRILFFADMGGDNYRAGILVNQDF
jgi:hypothetical protein